MYSPSSTEDESLLDDDVTDRLATASFLLVYSCRSDIVRKPRTVSFPHFGEQSRNKNIHDFQQKKSKLTALTGLGFIDN